mmetsp:Transcript_18238/g.27075  ORF Transcript_18238/g.27075 Transcript_18238/m.27075 type:complete len:227 (-) Transcript_18238:988-1668(-)
MILCNSKIELAGNRHILPFSATIGMVVGVVIQSVHLTARLAPCSILRPLGSPILTLTKDFEMVRCRVLQRTSNIHSSRITIHGSCSFSGAGGSDLSIVGRRIDAFPQQTMHLCNLTRMYRDGILHDTPMARETTVLTRTLRLFEASPAWRCCLCTRVTEVVFCLAINQGLIVVEWFMVQFEKFSMITFLPWLSVITILPFLEPFLIFLTVIRDPFLPLFIRHGVFS